MSSRTALLIVALLLTAVHFAARTAAAAVAPTGTPLRVDINPDNDRHDILSRDRENWRVKDGPEMTQKFGNLTITIRQAGDVGAGLTSAWWKGGIDTGALMATDGVTIKDGDDGAAMELVISGFSSGRHSVVTYHNWLNDTPGVPCSMSVDGKPTIKMLIPTQRVANDADAASAFLEVDAQADKDVVILIKGDAGRKPGNVILNGFEIDTADPHTKAIKPSPNHSDEHAAEGLKLTWTAPKAATAHQLYFGTNADAVAAATSASPEFKGNLETPSYTPKDLNTAATYFWRVDEVGADKSVARGDVWSFRVRHLAFPGAEGYGRFALGGRGGKVYEVTTLDDAGPGSLREAVEADGPRTVIFRIGGTIQLKDKLVIKNPYITVAGQTAPGDGICIRGATFGNYSTHDTIIRYVRVRVGDESGKTYDGMGFAGTDNAIIDHCSISWTIDESVSSRGAKNITFQRNIIAEALNMSVHSHYVGTGKGHSFAGSISGDIGSYHHNLVVNCAGRNWSLAGGLTQAGKMAGYLDIRNNVVYNWAHRTNDGGVKELNLVANYYIPGPASKVFHLLMPDTGNKGDPQQYFVTGNMMEGRPQYDEDNWKNGGVIFADRLDQKASPQVRLDKPFCEPFVTTQTAKGAYDNVMADVGANYPRYDAVDQRAVKDAQTRKVSDKGSKTGIPGIIDSQKDVGGWPELKSGDAPTDSDHDGMPDQWEKANNLNPADPADANADSAGDGYTNLERYLNNIIAAKPKPMAGAR